MYLRVLSSFHRLLNVLHVLHLAHRLQISLQLFQVFVLLVILQLENGEVPMAEWMRVSVYFSVLTKRARRLTISERMSSISL